MQLNLPIRYKEKLDVRKKNILSSPKYGGSCKVDSKPYLKELGVEIIEKKLPIQFTGNFCELVHRWVPYVQGFSAGFVQSIFDQYRKCYDSPIILDPFAGCGTVLVQSKLCSYKSVGTELNPLLHFITDVKVNSWDVKPESLFDLYSSIPKNIKTPAPEFLKSNSQFNDDVLKNLELLKGGIDSIICKNQKQKKVKNLVNLAFSSILIDCSNLKRTPCLGYWKHKKVSPNTPWILMEKKIREIAEDLRILQKEYRCCKKVESHVILANSMEYDHSKTFDLVITSPPYMNGLDYVMNYKIEMGWLDFIKNHNDAKNIKDNMVICDNVSKGLVKKFAQSNSKYTNDWLEQITADIRKNIEKRGAYRRHDMPHIVHKYFDDMHSVMKKVAASMKCGSRFILVVGDSLIADVYVPSDLLLARIGMEPEVGLTIEKIEQARNRHSGQIRNYRLRETIVTLKKI